MRLVLIADVYPPLKSSGAVQLRDLSIELVKQGHEVTVLVASPELVEPWQIGLWHGVNVVRLKTHRTKDMGYVRRTIGEFLMPFAMLRNLRKSPLGQKKWDGVIWYSPTIFLGPIVNALKRRSACKSYLIIRDIFPKWAVDMGLMGRGLPYRFFKAVADYQYSVADVIGIQTPGNSNYFNNRLIWSSGRVEVLQNWLADAPIVNCSISVHSTPLAGRKIFVYAGNMGVAQGMTLMLDLAEQFRDRSDIGFLFVGRGSDAKKMRMDAQNRALDNVVFYDEIDPSEIPGLYLQCHIGLVSLDVRHKTHNIPGKFLSYMQAGLPVLASVNPGNDIVDLIESENVGRVCTDASVNTLKLLAEEIVDQVEALDLFSERCKALSEKLFSSNAAARQIVLSLRSN